MTVRRVAALYVDAAGPYAGLAGVDCWPLKRDARRYAGPWPIVAHPPCGPWGSYAHKSHEDPELALRAVEQVQRYGGVLEHPAKSRLWKSCDLPQPGATAKRQGNAYTVEIRQVDFGHRASKPTWLYIVGGGILPPMPLPVPDPAPPRPYKSGRQPRGVLETLSKRQRKLTPPRLADWLVRVAQTCRL